MSTSGSPDSSTLSASITANPLLGALKSDTTNGHAILHGKKAVFIALGANITIGIIKLIAGLLGRHSALMSEALHSMADSINSGFLLIGLQKGSRAPDKTHPFGYGLETTLWAMLASVMMLMLASWSMYLGVHRFFHPEPFGNYLISAGVLLASMGLEAAAVNVASEAVLMEKDLQAKGWFNKFALASKHVRTTVSPTTRFVYYEDTIALIGTLIALVAITLSEFGVFLGWLPPEWGHIPDAVASVLIGLLLLGLALYLFLHNSKGLTGTSAGPHIEQKIREFVLSLTGVSQVHDLKTIDYGLSGVVVHMRVEVDPDTQVKDVDDLTERIRDRIQTRVGNVKEVIIEVLADETNIDWSDQFYRLVEQGRAQNILKHREERILRNVYDFTQSVVGDIMVPRTDVECIDVGESLESLLELIVTTGHTRIPVYQEDVDNMLGVIHAKDVFRSLQENKGAKITLQSLVRPLEIYPETKLLSDLLEEFKRQKIRMAMVADEHGGLAGIVTMEDILEEIVGDIGDEYNNVPEPLELVEPNRMVLSGRYEIDRLNEQFALGIPDEEFNTVGGFVFGQLGREPHEGDQITFEDMVFTVVDMDGHRVDKIQIEGPVAFTVQPDSEPLPVPPSTNTTILGEIKNTPNA